MKNPKQLYCITTDRGLTLRSAIDEDAAYQEVANEIGANNIEESHLATEADIAWVRGSNGRVPTLPKA